MFRAPKLHWVRTSIFVLDAILCHWPTGALADDRTATTKPANPIALSIASWSKFQDELIPLSGRLEDFTYETLLKSPTFRGLSANPDVGLCLEMCRQFDKTPFVAVAGLRLLQKHHPDYAMQGALLHFLLYKTGILPLLDFATEELKAKRDQGSFDRQFDRIINDSTFDDRKAALITICVPANRLRSWYHTRGDLPLPAILEAYVLDRLFDIDRDNEAEPTDFMKRRLKSLSRLPGGARLVYLQFAEISTNERVELLRQALCDDGLEDSAIQAEAYTNHQLIRDQIDLEKLAITPERRATITRMLERQAKRNAASQPASLPAP